MDKIEQIKQDFINGGISSTALYHYMKPHKVWFEQQYPLVDNFMSQLYLYVNDLPESASYCDRSDKNRRLKSITDGFMTFCGNQGSCICNKENSRKHLANRTLDEQIEINQKRKSTNLQKYGTDFASKLPEIKEKAAATCITKYGTKSPTENPEVLSKVKQTLLENYGVEYPQQHPDLAKKAEATWLKLRGVSRPAKDESVRKAMQDTMFSRYGVEHNMQRDDVKQIVKRKSRTKMFEMVIKARPSGIPLFTLDEFVEGNSSTEWKWQCNHCQAIFNQSIVPGNDVRCEVCKPKNESWGESMIRQWLDSHNVTYQQNTRKIISPLELDFYLPDLKIAIEFNGIYWHSEKILDERNYHFNKFKMCYDLGIKLIQVWEHDLAHKPTIIFSRLSHAIGLHKSTVIGARKCQFKEISAKIAREFFNSYHLQGFNPSGKYFGAFYQNELIAAASIGKTRYTKIAEYELTRYAIKSGITVPGALSKFLILIKEQYGSMKLVSYADLSWGYGDAYQTQGFVFSHFSKPNYFYFKDLDDIKSRIAFQKHKLTATGDIQTESQIAESMGYNRFFDAGNSVWLKQL